MEDTNNGSGSLWGPDQRDNPHPGTNDYQWEESGSGSSESNVRMGNDNYGNQDDALYASDEDGEGDDDFADDDADLTDDDSTDDDAGDWGDIDPESDAGYDPDMDPSGPGSAV
ncbi:MAG TPA: hypothetical protein VGB50_06555 [Flavobacterium sp.]|jgi:hypothetical protein